MPIDYTRADMDRLRTALRGRQMPQFTPGSREWYANQVYGTGVPTDVERQRAESAEFIGSMMPVLGESMALRDAWNASGRGGEALMSGDFGKAGSEYLGMLGDLGGALLPFSVNKLTRAAMPADPKNTTMIFAGPTAKTADHAALAKAQELAASGASRDDIWRETGWFQGVDGKWRFEIDDSAAQLSGVEPAPMTVGVFPAPENANRYTFSGLEHPELSAAYESRAPVSGYYGPGVEEGGKYAAPDIFSRDTYITAQGPDVPTAKGVTLHEKMHEVQNFEGFGRGGSPSEVTGIASRNKNQIEDLRDANVYARVLAGANGDHERALLHFRQVFDRDPRPGIRKMVEGRHYDDIYRQLREAEANQNATDIYRRHAGEVEARNVQTRMNMSAAERRATPPWETQDIPDDQQIVRFGNQGTAYSIPMDEASRMARAKQLGYADEPFYRGEATGKAYEGDAAFFSRDPEYAGGFAAKGGQSAPAEYRLNLTKTFSDAAPLTASDYGRIVEAAAQRDPELAANLAESIAPGKGVDWVIGFAKARPDFIVVEQGGAPFVRHAIERGSSDAVGLWRAAGYDALDSGRDVQKIGAEGIRSKNARFDPSKASSTDIMAGLAGASLLPAWLSFQESTLRQD